MSAETFTLVLIDAPPEHAADGDFAYVVGVTAAEIQAAADRGDPTKFGTALDWLGGLAETATKIQKAVDENAAEDAKVAAFENVAAELLGIEPCAHCRTRRVRWDEGLGRHVHIEQPEIGCFLHAPYDERSSAA